MLQVVDENPGTEPIVTINRGYQFPEEGARTVSSSEVVDGTFTHLFEKRRSIVDNESYSIDRFEEKATKYKWVGRAGISDNVEDMKKKLFLECLAFSVYNFFGIKTP